MIQSGSEPLAGQDTDPVTAPAPAPGALLATARERPGPATALGGRGGLGLGDGTGGRTRDRGRRGDRPPAMGLESPQPPLRRGRGRLRDRLDRDVAAVPDHRLGGVLPRREEALELGRRQLRVRCHVVAVLALEPVQRTGHPDARDPERRRHRRVGRGPEAGQDPAVVTVRDGQRDRQVRQSQPLDGRSQRRIEGPARDQPVAVVDEVTQTGGPAGRIHARGQREVVAVVPAHPVEVATLVGRAVVGLPIDDVAHDLDAGRRAPQPRLLGRERSVAVEVDAAGPGGQVRRSRLGRPAWADRATPRRDRARRAGRRASESGAACEMPSRSSCPNRRMAPPRPRALVLRRHDLDRSTEFREAHLGRASDLDAVGTDR